MKHALSNARVRDTHRNATDMGMLADPLRFLHEDHLRTRTVCTILDRLAQTAVPAPEDVFEALSYLENELPLLRFDPARSSICFGCRIVESGLFPIRNRPVSGNWQRYFASTWRWRTASCFHWPKGF